MRRSLCLFALLGLLALPACPEPPAVVSENCTNQIDDDDDGNIDCFDPECTGSIACNPEICNNQADDDADGKFDCDDPDCFNNDICLLCGNNAIDNAEDCDGANLDGQDCTTIVGGFVGGSLSCNANCTFNTAACSTGGAVCGDGVRNGIEECDGQDLAGQDCTDKGFAGGTLACLANCKFSTAACVGAGCGNGVVDAGETCDDQNQTNGDGCDNNCTLTACGNGIVTTTEQCDDGNLTANDGCENNCTLPECSNGIDDEPDGGIDLQDPGCSSPNDNSEQIFADTCNGINSPVFEAIIPNPANTTFTLTGNTAGQSLFNPSGANGDCAAVSAGTGPELVVVYRIPAGPAVNLKLDMSVPASAQSPGETDYDALLYVTQTNCGVAANEIFCSNNAVGNKPVITGSFPPGDYFFFIDGANNTSGNFKLVITPN
jgi:cysteine-rich repeat protein